MKTLYNFNKTLLYCINYKTIFSFIALVCFTQIGFGQVSENFDNWSDGSYGGINTYGEWVSNKALTETLDARSGKCVRLRNGLMVMLVHKEPVKIYHL